MIIWVLHEVGQNERADQQVTFKNGTTRYRFVTDGPRRPDGRRLQIRKTFDTKNLDRDEMARIRRLSATGTCAAPTKLFIDELLDLQLKSATRVAEEEMSSTRANVSR
ncbi:hypothetical protein [Streptomyces cadmiisoli]